MLTLLGQALALAKKLIFCNCLVTMRPKTTQKDLPSRHDIEVYIHNKFVAWLKTLKDNILVSNKTTSVSLDLSSYIGSFWWNLVNCRWVDSRQHEGSFLGMTASWIKVKGGRWRLCSEVVGFQPVSGDHSAWNLG